MSSGALDLEGPELVRVSRGVWLPDAAAEHQVARLGALVRALPPDTVISGITAAQLHGLWVPRSVRVDITVPAGARGPEFTTAPQRLDVVAHRRYLAAHEVVAVSGLQVTTLARTWWDLAAELHLPDLVAAGDSVLRTGDVRVEDLADTVSGSRRRQGARVARLALGMLDNRSRSRPESHVRVALLLAGLPYPQVNQPVYDDVGGWLAEPDLAYPEARLALEYQGAVHAEPRQMRKDAARSTDLQRCDWTVFCYTAGQVFTHPEIIARDAMNVILRRAPQLMANPGGSAFRRCRGSSS